MCVRKWRMIVLFDERSDQTKLGRAANFLRIGKKQEGISLRGKKTNLTSLLFMEFLLPATLSWTPLILFGPEQNDKSEGETLLISSDLSKKVQPNVIKKFQVSFEVFLGDLFRREIMSSLEKPYLNFAWSLFLYARSCKRIRLVIRLVSESGILILKAAAIIFIMDSAHPTRVGAMLRSWRWLDHSFSAVTEIGRLWSWTNSRNPMNPIWVYLSTVALVYADRSNLMKVRCFSGRYLMKAEKEKFSMPMPRDSWLGNWENARLVQDQVLC